MAQLASTTVFGDLVVTNNTKIMGHVGVGIDNPIRIVDILSPTAGENGGIVIRSATDNTRVAGHIWPGTSGFVIDAKAGDLTGSANLHLRTGGEERIYVAGATGNVGIGTTAPAYKLDINASSMRIGTTQTGNIQLYVGSNSTHRYLELMNAGGASGLKVGGLVISDSYSYANPGRNDLVVKGNVGIGVASPSAKLHVEGNVRFTGTLEEGSIPAARITSGTIDRARLPTASTSAAGIVQLSSSTSSTSTSVAATASAVKAAYDHASTRVSKSGDIMTGNLTLAGTSINIRRPSTTGGWARGITFYTDDGSTVYAGIGLLGSDTSISRLYMTHGESPWGSTLGINILSNGNVGIGTASPSAKLHVSGTARVDGVLNQNASSNGRLVLPVGSNKWAT